MSPFPLLARASRLHDFEPQHSKIISLRIASNNFSLLRKIHITLRFHPVDYKFGTILLSHEPQFFPLAWNTTPENSTTVTSFLPVHIKTWEVGNIKMEPGESHPPVLTHKKRKLKYHQRISPALFVPPTVQNSAAQPSTSSRIASSASENSPSKFNAPFDKTTVKDLLDFQGFKMFPNQVGLYPYGDLEKGFENLRVRKLDPKNVSLPSHSEVLCLQLTNY
jgi:hypothetical protein